MIYKGYTARIEEAVEDYLEMCEESGRPPQKPYSGNVSCLFPR